ncbi:MAG: ATP-binding protein [bacterium]
MMSYMPEWYRALRGTILLLQSIVALLLVTGPMKRRERYPLRLLVGTALACCIQQFISAHIYIPGTSAAAIMSHALVSMFTYLMLIGVAWLCYQETIWTVLFTTATGYLMQDIGGSVKTLLRLNSGFNRLASHTFGIIAADLISYGAVYLILFLVLRPFLEKREEGFDDKLKAVFSVSVLLLCIGMARLSQDNPVRNDMSIATEAIFQIIIDALVIAVQFGVMERARLTEHVEVMRELVHQQRVQYDASKESAQLINEKYHDLKHLLKSLRGTVPQAQIDQLNRSIAAYDRPADSGNEVLDVLLAEKHGICQQRNILLTCSLGHTDFSFVEELDLYSLFQNALSNAINAVSALPEDAERFISLSANRDGNMLTIHMENPCQAGIVFVDGLPQTQGDPDWHGFGMRSMNRIAEKYNGMLTAEQRGKVFLLDILLLAPDA